MTMRVTPARLTHHHMLPLYASLVVTRAICSIKNLRYGRGARALVSPCLVVWFNLEALLSMLGVTLEDASDLFDHSDTAVLAVSVSAPVVSTLCAGRSSSTRWRSPVCASSCCARLQRVSINMVRLVPRLVLTTRAGKSALSL